MRRLCTNAESGVQDYVYARSFVLIQSRWKQKVLVIQCREQNFVVGTSRDMIHKKVVKSSIEKGERMRFWVDVD